LSRYVALLRGVNVGGNRKIPMPELRDLFEALGYSAVVTFIQSGNVVFSAEQPVSAVSLDAAIEERFGIANADVVLRTAVQLRRVIDAHPYRGIDDTKLHVGFMTRKPAPASVEQLDLAPFHPEQALVRGAEIYFYLPNGMGRTKLPSYIDRRLGVPTTIRNWNTTTKLLELAL
jgi:uncharacterized protein (DUF1697 family)